MLDLQALEVAAETIDASCLLLQQIVLVLNRAFHITDSLLLVLIDTIKLADFDVGFFEFELVCLSDVPNLNHVGLSHLIVGFLMLFDEAFDFHSVSLMNLGGHLVADVLVKMLDLLIDTSLQLGPCARALSELIFTVVVFTPFNTSLLSQLLNYLKFVLEDLFQVGDFDLQSISVDTTSFQSFLLHYFDLDFLRHQKVLVSQDVSFQILDLLLEKFLELGLDKLALSIENGESRIVRGLNDMSVQEYLLLAHLDLSMLQLDSMDLRLG